MYNNILRYKSGEIALYLNTFSKIKQIQFPTPVESHQVLGKTFISMCQFLSFNASNQTPPIDGETFVNQILERFRQEHQAQA
ncbi:hypothetical protein [Nostoc sp. ChiQUE01b]|uniref:hypothetical protein n=1 Tax=Nostoc sp. ChiQUE01b TaxID=3075376 RepID=UPI002AD59870|nr:hypothetical protein [Nostoc sp. ChiQUE01b]MDZ8258894.1 hypothetical protein [Nostoc sp. ChiQUE01b]